jgi:prefoldin subunit 5
VLGRSIRTRPFGDAIAVRLPGWPSAKLATPVLAVAALLAGAGVGSAVFATLWHREASGRQAAEEQLAVSQDAARRLRAELAGLQSRLDASRKTAAAAGRAAERGTAVVSALAQGAQPLVATAGSLQDQAGSLTARSSTLSSLIGTLNKDLASLASYVGDSSGATLDPAFLKTQLDYLTPSLDKVGAASASLAAEVGTYSQTVQAFVGRLATYAKTIRPPGRR